MSSKFGGQALIEGIMIRGALRAAVVIRKEDGTFVERTYDTSPWEIGKIRNVPILRGLVVLIDTLVIGTKALNFSAYVSSEDMDVELYEEKKQSPWAVIPVVIFSFVFAIGIFFIVPILISNVFEGFGLNTLITNAIEGILRLLFLIGYIWLISLSKEIQRVFQYHGAEHMAVAAFEHDENLEIEELKKYPTEHPRCGTSFLITIFVIALIIFMFFPREPLWFLITSRLILIPLLVAISYEIIRFSGSNENSFLFKIISWPGIFLQKITTKKPNDDQLELAIHCMKLAIKENK